MLGIVCSKFILISRDNSKIFTVSSSIGFNFFQSNAISKLNLCEIENFLHIIFSAVLDKPSFTQSSKNFSIADLSRDFRLS